MNEVDVSVIICTRNRTESLRATLASLASVDVPEGCTVELVVIDNGSSDSTRSVVESAQIDTMTVRYVMEPKCGLSSARNRALKEARGCALLFTDDDIRFPPNWIDGMCRPILDGSAQVIAGGVKLAPHLIRPWFEPYHRAIFAETTGLNQEDPQCIVGANMAFARSVADTVPNFDEELGAGNLGYSEETLYILQLMESGHTIRPAFDVCVEHHFDEARLLRTNLIGIAERQGRSSAYISYHWRHRKESSLVLIRLLRLHICLAFHRLTHFADMHRREGLSKYEARIIQVIACHRQYLVEQKRPRNYALFGFVKLAAN